MLAQSLLETRYDLRAASSEFYHVSLMLMIVLLQLLLMPVAQTLTVKGIEQDGKSIPLARAGDNVDLGIANIDPSALRFEQTPLSKPTE